MLTNLIKLVIDKKNECVKLQNFQFACNWREIELFLPEAKEICDIYSFITSKKYDNYSEIYNVFKYWDKKMQRSQKLEKLRQNI